MTTTDARPTTLISLNPATGSPIGEVPITSAAEIDAAVARAQAARAEWQALGARGRADRLAAVADLIEARSNAIGDLITAEMGKPLRAGRGEAASAAYSLRDLDTLIDAVEPHDHHEDGVTTRIVRDPLGVVALITPWNFPVSMAQSMLVPALVAGNTIVSKPSEMTPLTGAALHACYAEVLPPGVMELVQGADEVGKRLVAADVQMVAFVGSQQAGKSIMAAAAGGLKRLVLELGGKDPMVVLEDADLDRAADFAVNNSFRNSGQVCVSVERIYVDERIADAFESKVIEKARAYRVGPGTDDVDMGPMVSSQARQHVLEQLEDSRTKGAEIVMGGEILDRPGFFLTPAVVRGATDEMALIRDETFGPVLTMMRVASADEAIAKANSTPYGLGATLWSADPERAAHYGAQLDAGMVGINRSIGGVSGTPWVGAKQSGFGFTGSQEGIRQFTQVRKISWTSAG